MANKKRLIDYDMARDATYEEVFWTESEQAVVRHFLAKIPKVDAVEVVRCKDCKHGMKSHLQPRHAKNYLCRHSWEGEYHEPDHFCSCGERRSET